MVPRHARGVLGLERRRARLGVPPAGRRAVRARRRPRSTSQRSACWRCSPAAPSRTRGWRSSSSPWPSPSAFARRSPSLAVVVTTAAYVIQASAASRRGAARRGAVHRHAGRVSRLGRRRLRDPLAAPRTADGARRRASPQDRSRLLSDALAAEQRERKALAEALHDHAIQNLLSARHELEEAGETLSHPALDRADAALAETVGPAARSRLRPAPLRARGGAGSRPRSVRSAGRQRVAGAPGAAARSALPRPVTRRTSSSSRRRASCWRTSFGTRTPPKSASASPSGTASSCSSSRTTAGASRRGCPKRLADGHIGLAAQRVRVEAAGGRMELLSAPGDGTRVEVRVPSTVAESGRADG